MLDNRFNVATIRLNQLMTEREVEATLSLGFAPVTVVEGVDDHLTLKTVKRWARSKGLGFLFSRGTNVGVIYSKVIFSRSWGKKRGVIIPVPEHEWGHGAVFVGLHHNDTNTNVGIYAKERYGTEAFIVAKKLLSYEEGGKTKYSRLITISFTDHVRVQTSGNIQRNTTFRAGVVEFHGMAIS